MIYQCKNNTKGAVVVAASPFQLVCSGKFLCNGGFLCFMGAAAWDDQWNNWQRRAEIIIPQNAVLNNSTIWNTSLCKTAKFPRKCPPDLQKDCGSVGCAACGPGSA